MHENATSSFRFPAASLCGPLTHYAIWPHVS